MAIPHAASGELIDVRPLGAALRQTSSSTLVRDFAVGSLRTEVMGVGTLRRHTRLHERKYSSRCDDEQSVLRIFA